MALSAVDLSTLSRLLDEALDLPAESVEAWLAGLAVEHAALVPQLRQMLAERTGGDGFLASSPILGERDGTVASPGELVGAYRLVREIGKGGMGTVWLAERADGTLKRLIALKLPRLAWGAGLAERMTRERDIGSLLEHPNIARLYDAGVDERGRPYLALEYVDGQPIDAWCKEQALSVRARLELIMQVAHAVSYAHGRLVVHRDLKPSNVLVTPDGQTHLLDFGIAKLLHYEAPGEIGLTQDQGRVLTPHFASPEQMRGEAITVQSDVYSLGVLTYELLTNNAPYQLKRKTLGALEEAILEGEPALASSRATDKATAKTLRGEIDAILAKALRRDPAQRYATADALANDIERHLAGERVLAQPDTTLYRLRKALWRHRIGFTAVCAVVLAVVAVVAGSAEALLQARRATEAAVRERLVRDFIADVFRLDGRTVPEAPRQLDSRSPNLVLEGGAELIQKRFSGQPDLQAELYGVVGEVFSNMGAYKLAVSYSIKQVETLAILNASRHDQTVALLALAQARFNDQQFGDAESHVRRALELSRGHAELRVEALALLARVLLERGRFDEATTTSEELEARLDEMRSKTSVARAWALFLRGRLLVAGNRLDAALPIFRQAIDMAQGIQGKSSHTSITMRLEVAYRLATTSRAELAQQFFEPAISALQELGGVHLARAALESARFTFRRRTGFSQGTAAEAWAVMERSRAALVSMRAPIPDWFIPQVDFWMGALKMNDGDIAGAMPLLESNIEILDEALSTPADRFTLSWVMGSAYMLSGRHDLADRWLRGRMRARREMGSVNHPFAAGDYVYLSRNFLMQGRFSEARAVLDQAPHFGPISGEGGSNPDRYQRTLLWTRVEISLAEGDGQGALNLLGDSRPGNDEFEGDKRRYDGLMGEALCAAAQGRKGLPILSQVLAANERDEDDVPTAPGRARLHALIGLCALAVGDRARALSSEARSTQAFAAQPDVSPYFKRPLVQLNYKLAHP